MLLIGSRAAHHYHPEQWPSYNDLDVVCTYQDFKKFVRENKISATPIGKNKFVGEWKCGRMIEFEIAWPDSSGFDLLSLVDEKQKVFIDEVEFLIPSMNWLFALKASHKFKKNCPHFAKTMRDYTWMRNNGCTIPNNEWFKKREKETYIKKRPNLNTSKDNFFRDSELKYVYDHDTIHVAVAHLELPAYEYYKSDNAEVFCSKEKWDDCSTETKLYGVLEESYVLALERSQIPFGEKVSPKGSFMIALMKVCTSITSGWFRDFAYENYYEVLSMYSRNYLKKFKEGVDNGIVKRIEEMEK